MASLDTLFVVGSFSSGMVHFAKIEPFAAATRAASAHGALYRLPSGVVVFASQNAMRPSAFRAAAPYELAGALVELRSPDAAFAILDAYHGCSPLEPEKSLFWRDEIQTIEVDGRVTRAAVYALNPDRAPANARLIEDGDWRRSWAERPPLIERLTPRQRAYLLKLSTSGSRAIVPIDLQLYRELMGLELVIDKGRRLALTSLGQEVARFLA